MRNKVKQILKHKIKSKIEVRDGKIFATEFADIDKIIFTLNFQAQREAFSWGVAHEEAHALMREKGMEKMINEMGIKNGYGRLLLEEILADYRGKLFVDRNRFLHPKEFVKEMIEKNKSVEERLDDVYQDLFFKYMYLIWIKFLKEYLYPDEKENIKKIEDKIYNICSKIYQDKLGYFYSPKFIKEMLDFIEYVSYHISVAIDDYNFDRAIEILQRYREGLEQNLNLLFPLSKSREDEKEENGNDGEDGEDEVEVEEGGYDPETKEEVDDEEMLKILEETMRKTDFQKPKLPYVLSRANKMNLLRFGKKVKTSRIHRIYSSSSPLIFTKRRRDVSIHLMLDCSGSMSPKPQRIRELVKKFPNSRVDIYWGYDDNNPYGVIRTVSDSGRIADLAAFKPLGINNSVDVVALHTLATSGHKIKIFVSDGGFCGGPPNQEKAARRLLMKLLLDKRILWFKTWEDFEENLPRLIKKFYG